MSPKMRWSTAMAAFAVACVACVRVPDSIKAEFRAPEPDERSNYQPGLHGAAPAADASDPWSRWGAANLAAAIDGGGAEADSGTGTEGDAGRETVYPTPALVIPRDGGTP
jgi:hypothetical protein